jgi:hypothetical protein
MILYRTVLSAALFVSVQVSAGENDCRETSTADAKSFKERAERLFLAYTNNTVKSYDVAVLDCGKELVVTAIPTGPDARIGGIVTVSYAKDDRSITIRPGE